MAEYAKMKNAELEALLKERGLPHTGKKAELVKRLQDSDAAANDAPAAVATKPEEAVPSTDKQAMQEPAPAPAPVPEAASASEPPASVAAHTAPAPAAAEAPAPAAPAKDFTAGLAATSLDEEIARRKARAAKFGTDPAADETLRALERAKKFGGGGATSEAGSSSGDVVGKMDRALPDGKRKRERGDEGGAAKKVAASGQAAAKVEKKPERKDGMPAWMTEADRQKAEARKAKFATAQ